MAQVGHSREYEVVLKAQLERVLQPLWNEAEALSERIVELEEELAALGEQGRRLRLVG